MKTIGAKELRQQLDKILDRVLDGEDIIVSHRFKGPVRLSAVHVPAMKTSERMAGLRAFDTAPKRVLTFESDKSIKQLYKESLTEKYDK